MEPEKRWLLLFPAVLISSRRHLRTRTRKHCSRKKNRCVMVLKTLAECKVAQQAIRENTAKLRALRLARDAAKQSPKNERYKQRQLMFSRYRRKQIAELRPYQLGESLDGISISDADRQAGSPKAGDMIARNPKNHDDRWLVGAQYFEDNFEPIERPERV
jgi:hypothetical protein